MTQMRRAAAQTPAPAVAGPPQPTRFQELESTYLENLKRVHAPLLQQYMTELKTLLERSPAAEADAVKAEIVRVQKIIGDGGVVEIASPGKPSGPVTPAAGANRIVFTLEPHEAVPPQPDDKPVPLGTATWTLSKLGAGSYDVIAHYTCQELAANPVVKINFHGKDFSRELKSSNVTKNDSAFRVMRLCQIELKEDTTFEKFTVTASTTEPWYFVKQILIVKSKEADK